MSNNSSLDKTSLIINSFSKLPSETVKNRFSDLPWGENERMYAIVRGSIVGLKKYQYSWVKRYIQQLSKTDEMDSFNELVNIVKEFEKHKNTLENKEILSYNTIADIRNAIETPSNRFIKRNKRVLLKEEYEIVHKDEKITIYFPHSEKASCEIANRMGHGSVVWCTAAEKSTNYFDNYIFNYNINLYYILSNEDKKSDFNKISISFNRNDNTSTTPIYESNSSTVNSRNTMLLRDDFINIFGEDYWQNVENKLIEFNKNIKIHPNINYTKNGEYKYLYTDDEYEIESFINSVNTDNVERMINKLFALSKNKNLTNELNVLLYNKISKLIEGRNYINRLVECAYNIIDSISFNDTIKNLDFYFDNLLYSSSYYFIISIYQKVQTLSEFELIYNKICLIKNEVSKNDNLSTLFHKISLNKEFESDVFSFIKTNLDEKLFDTISNKLLSNKTISEHGVKLIIEHYQNNNQDEIYYAKIKSLDINNIPGHKNTIINFINNYKEKEIETYCEKYERIKELPVDINNIIINNFFENKKIINNMAYMYSKYNANSNISKDKIKYLIESDLYKNDMEFISNLIKFSSIDEDISLLLVNISNEHAKFFLEKSYHLDGNITEAILFKDENALSFEMQKEFVKIIFNRLERKHHTSYYDSEIVSRIFSNIEFLEQIIKDNEFCNFLSKRNTDEKFEIKLASSNFMEAKKNLSKNRNISTKGVIALLKNNNDFSIINSVINWALSRYNSIFINGINEDIDLQIKLSKDKRTTILKKVASFLNDEESQINIIKSNFIPAIIELAKNNTITEKTQEEIIKVYKNTKNNEILENLISNKNLTENVVELLSDEDPIKTKIAFINECVQYSRYGDASPKLTIELQSKYATDENVEVRLAMANAVNKIHQNTCDILSSDENESVRHAVYSNINYNRLSDIIFNNMINEDRQFRFMAFEKLHRRYDYRDLNISSKKDSLIKILKEISDLEKFNVLNLPLRTNSNSALSMIIIETSDLNEIFIKSELPEIREAMAKLIQIYTNYLYEDQWKIDINEECILIMKNEKDKYIKKYFDKILNNIKK